MRFNAARFVAAAAALLLASALVAPTVPAQSPMLARVTMLFDLGDGTYYWTQGEIYRPTLQNTTWNATLVAAASLGLAVRWSWYSCCGVLIQDIGNMSPSSGAVGIFVWNATSHGWDAAQTGVSSLVLVEGQTVAFYDDAFDPVTYDTRAPTPTPDHPYPVTAFRGADANAGDTLSSAPDGVHVAWDRDLGVTEIESSPIVAGGHVYVLTLDGLFALDEDTGAVVWTNLSLTGLSTPAFYHDALLVDGRDGRVHGVDAATGRELWNTTLVSRPGFSGITSSPKILLDTAYVGTFNESGGSGEVAALWATNGTIMWRHVAPGSVSFSSPAIGNGTLFVGIIGRYNTTTQVTYDPPYGIMALNATTGAERWFTATNASVASSPVFAGSSVFATAKNGYACALDPGTGRILWNKATSAGVSSPAFHAGTLYVAGGTGAFGGPGAVTALDTATERVLWRFTPNGIVQSSVTYADGLVFFSTNVANGTIYAVDAATGDLTWSYRPSPSQYIFGSPVVADGRAFAPSDNGHVYAFDLPTTLATINVTAPTSLALGETGTLTVRYSAPGGRLRDATVRLALTELVVVSAQPGLTANRSLGGSQMSFSWSLGDVPFGGSGNIVAQVRGECQVSLAAVCTSGIFNQGATLAYNGSVNSNFAWATTGFNVEVIKQSGGSPGDILWIVAVGVGLAAAAVAVFLVIRHRRRSPRGP